MLCFYMMCEFKFMNIIKNYFLSIKDKYSFAIFMLFLVSFFWGITFTVIKSALDHIDPYYFIVFRFLVSALPFLFFIKKWNEFLKRDLIKDALILGVLNLACYILQTVGLLYTTATNSAFITSFYVLFVPFIGFLLFKSKITVVAVIASILAFVGLSLLMSFDLSNMNFGDIITFGCAVCYAGHIVFTGKITHKHNTINLVFYQISFVSVFGFVFVPFGNGKLDLNFEVISVIIFTALFCTTFAVFMQTKYQKIVKATTTAVIFATEPVFATLAAAVLNNEILHYYQYIGCSMIVLATIVVQIKFSNKFINILRFKQRYK